MTSIADLPFGVRYPLAIRLVREGAIVPEEALRLVVWPSREAIMVPMSDEPIELCVHGHVRSEENTYIRPDGSKKCRVCEREKGRENRKQDRRKRKKVPCSICGEPCSRNSRSPVPRCRACFRASFRPFVIRK